VFSKAIKDLQTVVKENLNTKEYVKAIEYTREALEAANRIRTG
jgi:hypothetical protein